LVCDWIGRERNSDARPGSRIVRSPLKLRLRARGLAYEHGERLERAENDEFEFHHASHAERKLFEKLMRLGSGGAVHDEDDAVRFVLEEPLVDFAGQMESDGRTYFER
jgi:hypothetical protein